MAIAAWCVNLAERGALPTVSRAHAARQLSAPSRAWRICRPQRRCSQRAWAAAARCRSNRCCRPPNQRPPVRPQRFRRARNRHLPLPLPRNVAQASLGRGTPRLRSEPAPRSLRYECVRPAHRARRAVERLRSPSRDAHRHRRREERVNSRLRPAAPGLGRGGPAKYCPRQ